MLRSLALAARQSTSCLPRNTLSRALAAEATEPQVHNPPKARGNSGYVKRRRSYLDNMHLQRITFQNDLTREEGSDRENDQADQADILAARQARAERKRAKSEAKQERAKELLEETRKAKEVRQVYRKADWERKQKELVARRAADLQLLVEHSHEWITEDTLQEHVDRAVDEFFIEVREEEAGPKVVGW